MKAIELQVAKFFAGKKIALLGYGQESKSSLRLIRSYWPKVKVDIWNEGETDTSAQNRYTRFYSKIKFKKVDFASYDMVLCSPGIPRYKLPSDLIQSGKLFGQSELFLRWFGAQTIGVTGTKGKSTTTSLIFHLLKFAKRNVLLGGNIGVPLFDLISKINPSTFIVAELSCHQLNGIKQSPHISVLLNLYEEHLDYYKTVEKYFASKLSIFENQNRKDILIYNYDDVRIKDYLKSSSTEQVRFSYSLKSAKADLYIGKEDKVVTNLVRGNPFSVESKLLGRFNLYNILPAIAVTARLRLKKQTIIDGLASYSPLPHRLQYLGMINDVKFVNDSISTIPEACLAAVKALKNIGSLFIGGFDRKIDYSSLIDFLPKQKIQHIVFFDKAGKRIYQKLQKENPKYLKKINALVTNDFSKAVQFCVEHTPSETYCLLSPAASSYGIFKNFEERGRIFEEYILKWSGHKKFTF